MTLDINQIEFNADGCEGDCPIFSMRILNTGAANYNANMFNERQGKFKTVIKKPQLDSLMTLIQNSNFFNLKSNYSSPYTDHPTYTLKVKLNDGRTKTIEDYGPNGPDEIRKVYDFIFSLRNSQQWK